jgi:hypothetical protein
MRQEFLNCNHDKNGQFDSVPDDPGFADSCANMQSSKIAAFSGGGR